MVPATVARGGDAMRLARSLPEGQLFFFGVWEVMVDRHSVGCIVPASFTDLYQV